MKDLRKSKNKQIVPKQFYEPLLILSIKIILRCHPERSAAESKDLGEAGQTKESSVNKINM